MAALSRWFTAVAGRASAPARWLAIGDSITEGQGASTRPKRWVDLVKTSVRSNYAVGGGYGYQPAYYSVYTPDSPWGILAATTGTVTWDNWIANLGYRHATLSAGATLIYTVTGTAADLWWASNGGTFTWKVDGGSATAVNTAGTYHADNKTRISLGASGSHTIYIAATTGPVYFSGIAVFDGDTTSGIQFYDSGHTGFTVANFLADTTEFPRAVAAVAPDLVTIELGLNDASAVSPATFQTNLQTLVNQLKALTTVPSILLVAAYQPAPNVTGGFLASWPAYIGSMQAIVDADPTRVALLDLTKTMPTADTSGTGLYRTDGLHPSDSGHAAIAAAVGPLLVPNVTATPHPEAVPPLVVVDVSGLPPTAATVKISRLVEGQVGTVRGASAMPVAGPTGGVTDYEAPFGTPILYNAQVLDNAGAVLTTMQSAAVQLDVDVMWISDPLAPGISTPCRGVKSPESFASLTYEVTSAISPVEGAELPILMTGQRRAASAVPLIIIAKDAAEASPIRQVLRYAQPFQLRFPARWQVPLPKMAYGFADSVSDNLFGGGTPGRSHLTLTFTLVAPPAADVAVPVRSYADLLAEANTYGDLPWLWGTYLDMLRG